MEMNKKILFLILLGILILPTVVFAQLHSYGSDISLGEIVDNIVGSLWVVFAGIAVVCFLVAGVMFLTAAGDAGKLKTARDAFLWGVVGVVIGILAYSMINIVGSLIS